MGDFEEIEDYLDIMKEMGLEGKMRALMLAREALLERDQDVGIAKKTMMDWIKDFEGTGNELVALKAIKDGVVELGTDVCRMFGDLMVAKFHEFKSTLESLNESKYFVVTKKLIGALETVKKEDGGCRRRCPRKVAWLL
ncbi:hypothetical protein ACOSP7_011650 [Xanthoceras sorbifolium]